VQVNLGAAELIVSRVLDWIEPAPTDAVLDVYAGVGAFSLPLARRTAAVSRRRVPPAGDGRSGRERRRAGLMNVQVQTGLAEELLPRLTRVEGSIDLAVVDPPRRGCSNGVLDSLIVRRPRRIAYVSCEPSTLARDLRRLVDAGYRLQRSGVVDLFPQTYHLESVSLLEWAPSA
jgi:23S rRNA (uracil1939-C5)-methyltransferase